MKLADRTPDRGLELRGLIAVARREFTRTMLSMRSFLALGMLFLMVVGGAYGMTQLFLADSLGTVSAIVYKHVDSVLYITSSFSALMVPIAAVIISFDGIVHERMRGTMCLLLVKPISRETIAIGKYLGAFCTVSIHILVVSLPAIGVITYFSGDAPSAGASLSFIVMTMILGGAYVGVTQAASALSKSHGSAVMAGFSVWLLFTLFWILIPMSIAYAYGLPFDVNDQGFLEMSNRIDLFNPNGAYNLYLAYTTGNGFLTAGVDLVAVMISSLLWFFLPIIALVTVFGRSEG